MCTERVRGWAQFGHGEMFGILVKVLLPRRLLEDAVPADFGVELDLPLSTTTPCHELSFQREDRLRDLNGSVRPSVGWVLRPVAPLLALPVKHTRMKSVVLICGYKEHSNFSPSRISNWTTASGGGLDSKAGELTRATGPTNVMARGRVIAGSVGVHRPSRGDPASAGSVGGHRPSW